jgi:hypothetical protein
VHRTGKGCHNEEERNQMQTARTARSAAIVAAAFAAFALMATSASALVFSNQIAGFGSPQAAFTSLQGLATNAQGDLYVENGKESVLQFSPAGGYLQPQPLTGSAAPLGGFAGLQGLAVDQATGDVYVSGEELSGFVDRIGKSGEPLGQLLGTPFEEFGLVQAIAVDSNSDLFVDNRSASVIDEFGPPSGAFPVGAYLEPQPLTNASAPLSGSKTPLNEFTFEGVFAVAVNSQGDVYVAENGFEAKRVDEFGPKGELLGQITGTPGPGSGEIEGFTSPRNIAVGPEGNLYVSDASKKVVDEFNSKREFVRQLTGVPALGEPGAPSQPGAFGRTGAVAVDAEGDLYVADTEKNVVDEFSAKPPPAVQPALLTADTGTSAVLNGSVNPNGATVTSCEFEYGLGVSGPLEHTVSCVPPPAAEAFEPVRAEITGLLADTAYHYVLRAASVHGKSATSEQVFTSAAVAPVIGATSVSEVTQFSGVLSGSITPMNTPVAYHFAYGTSSAYESVAPVPDLTLYGGEAPLPVVSQTLTGLQPGTTYHYALVVKAPGTGASIAGPDQTFTTPPIPAPVPVTGGASAISESAVTLTGSVNPEGWETTYSFRYGTSPGYGQEWPTVPVALGGLDGAQPVSVFVERLQPSTTYWYTVCASNQGAPTPVCGAPQAFRTSEYPASVMQVAPLTASIGLPPPKETKPTTGGAKKCKRGDVRKHGKCVRKPKAKSKRKK